MSASQVRERQNCSSVNVMSSILDWNMKLPDWKLDKMEEGDELQRNTVELGKLFFSYVHLQNEMNFN